MGPFYGQCGLVDNVAADVKKNIAHTHNWMSGYVWNVPATGKNSKFM
jgi:hypothetical protein